MTNNPFAITDEDRLQLKKHKENLEEEKKNKDKKKDGSKKENWQRKG